ncbi:uncharacterized protein LOC110702817 [Chenopodium quinoa]|uniref:uncharacterized protein LOC110702817 n=1 Tax=Chenopodium quinoa TaxID=63459 RepID=UPI000B76EE80|nr:uncharacterized protein LOC110702817 [Chenopodium quinoa]
MNSDSNSSSSSSSGLFDYMVNDYVEWHESITQRQKEDELIEEAINTAVVPFVTSTYQVPFTLEPTYQRWYVPRDREYVDIKLYNDYFSPQPLYPANMFRQRFRMTIRMLAYGTSADAVDEYLKIASSIAREGLAHFVEGVVAQFGPEYLRRANIMDTKRLLRESYARGFPGMMGSIDCMHWEWKNCPRAWKGMYQGRSKTSTVILEAVASQDLWIWHAFFGTPGSCNDINVLQRSPVFSDICEGKAPEVTFNVNGNTYNMGYYLTDDERDGYLHYDATEFINDQPQNVAESSTSNNNQPFTVRSGRLDRLNLNGYMENRNNVRDRETHIALKNDLVEHIWGRFGDE